MTGPEINDAQERALLNEGIRTNIWASTATEPKVEFVEPGEEIRKESTAVANIADLFSRLPLEGRLRVFAAVQLLVLPPARPDRFAGLLAVATEPENE